MRMDYAVTKLHSHVRVVKSLELNALVHSIICDQDRSYHRNYQLHRILARNCVNQEEKEEADQ